MSAGRIYGVSRVADNPHALIISFDARPSNDQIRIIHEALRPLIKDAMPAERPDEITRLILAAQEEGLTGEERLAQHKAQSRKSLMDEQARLRERYRIEGPKHEIVERLEAIYAALLEDDYPERMP